MSNTSLIPPIKPENKKTLQIPILYMFYICSGVYRNNTLQMFVTQQISCFLLNFNPTISTGIPASRTKT